MYRELEISPGNRCFDANKQRHRGRKRATERERERARGRSRRGRNIFIRVRVSIEHVETVMPNIIHIAIHSYRIHIFSIYVSLFIFYIYCGSVEARIDIHQYQQLCACVNVQMYLFFTFPVQIT